jgi:hypothetical protein
MVFFGYLGSKRDHYIGFQGKRHFPSVNGRKSLEINATTGQCSDDNFWRF